MEVASGIRPSRAVDRAHVEGGRKEAAVGGAKAAVGGAKAAVGGAPPWLLHLLLHLLH